MGGRRDDMTSVGLPEDTVYISRLVVDIPSTDRPGHIHRAGTEIAPVRRRGDRWEVSIRTGDPGAYWYETLLISKEQSELVEVPASSIEEI